MSVASTQRLSAALVAVCPIAGVSVGTPGDNATVRIDFDQTATDAQKAAAAAALAAFDWSDSAQQAWLDAQHSERTILQAAAAQAVADNTAYLALATPTAAQVATQVRKLTQQNTAVIKRLVQL